MFRPVEEVEARPDFRLWLRYDDGTSGEVDLSYLAGRGVFAIWSEPGAFDGVQIGPHGHLLWKGDVDLCADALYLKLAGKTPEQVFPGLRGTVVGA